MEDHVIITVLNSIIAKAVLLQLYEGRRKYDRAIRFLESTSARCPAIPAASMKAGPALGNEFFSTEPMEPAARPLPLDHHLPSNASHAKHSSTSSTLIEAQASRHSGHRESFFFEPSRQPEAVDSTTTQNSCQHLDGLDLPTLFCTFCAEAGHMITFRGKYDLNVHERREHLDNTDLQWLCKAPVCSSLVFRSKNALTSHMAKHHPEKEHAWRPVQMRRLYGCGFTGCRHVSSTWSDRTGHVGRCGQKSTTWDSSQTVRNLLEHENYAQVWAEVRGLPGSNQHISSSEIEWDLEITRQLRPILENGDFSSEQHMRDFLQCLFKAGRRVSNPDTTPAGGDPPATAATFSFMHALARRNTSSIPNASMSLPGNDFMDLKLDPYLTPCTAAYQNNDLKIFDQVDALTSFDRFSSWDQQMLSDQIIALLQRSMTSRAPVNTLPLRNCSRPTNGRIPLT
ncbi:hypothetical protein CC80DRAFT_558446 [Byssothecium circinans]|uniref:Uncharacterized protein n=1 Tax=Byssothecium circinans TaxID=147558 RepID=A0A6A5U1R8_9PLEO|nr:hypothetical protein CC80DRAFT_558446 [Byssothecium circinans]